MRQGGHGGHHIGRNQHSSLEHFFALQRGRVKAKVARHGQHLRERIGKIEPDIEVEVRGSTGGAPKARYDDEDRRRTSQFALFGAW